MNWKSILQSLLIVIAGLLGGAGATQVAGCGKGAVVPPPPVPDVKPDPKPEPKPDPKPRPEPLAAICKLVMPGSYCSGTVVGPKRTDGRYNIVSAAHCFKVIGENVKVLMRDGQTLSATVGAIDRRADAAILLTDVFSELPFTYVASATPAPATRIWHAGFGFDKPANREDGNIVAGPNVDGQVQYRLNVSSGDSGGGILVDGDGRLLSPVCCTTKIAGIGDVWGASPEIINRMLARPTDFIDVPPHEMPLIKLDANGLREFKPMPSEKPKE